jgi:hypothetical protein
LPGQKWAGQSEEDDFPAPWPGLEG